MKARSVRKPLKEVSNNNDADLRGGGGGEGAGGGRFSKSADLKKKSIMPEKPIRKPQTVTLQEIEEEEDSCLDRLMLIHSDLSSLTRQIDEFVVQAFQVKATNKEGRQEIESFTHVLSIVISSLKPWVPRLQSVLSSPSLEPENQLVQSLAEDKTVAAVVNEDEKFKVDSPEGTKDMDSLISPSPLVSWRADCNIERGRQLFLLTPLPMSKTFSSTKFQDLSKSVFEQQAALNPVVKIQSFETSGDVNGNLLEGVTMKPTLSKPSDSSETEGKSTIECGLVSSPIVSRRDQSMIVTTPCLKMSPPRTCVLLEPISAISHKHNYGTRKSTPYPVRLPSQGSESSDSGGSEDLAFKYPELLGIQEALNCRMVKKGSESSPNWSFSPPKTCVILEPPDEKSVLIVPKDHQFPIKASISNQQTKQYDIQDGYHQIKKSYNKEPIDSSLTLVESTPLWKEPESTIRTGKQPGENTLKKELWTRFEAASTYGIRLNAYAFQGTARKGFLDMLDEVSCDGKSPASNSLR